MNNSCCRLTPEQSARLDVIQGYIGKLLGEQKSPAQIAKEEGISEEEVRKAFSEILSITGNELAMQQINDAIAEFDAKKRGA